MLGTYFYHEILRKTVIAFGTLFNDIRIRHKDGTSSISEKRVALAYGPMQKFLARLEQQADLNRAVQKIELPRMSFEMNTVSYDSTRKAGITQTFKASDGTNLKKVFMPVPYNIGFELNILCKLNDDALQIVEQILPYFQPSYNLTVQLVETIKEKRDIPIVLENVTMDDQYEGNFTTRRVLLYTLRFSAKTYLFGPVSTATSDIIKKSSINYISGGSKSVERDVTYSVTPRATKDYTGDILTNLTEDIDEVQTTMNVTDGTALTVKTYVDVDDEEMYITKITSNKITVERGKDGRVAAAHVNGSEIKGITAADDALIELGDDFGFSGEYTQDAGLF